VRRFLANAVGFFTIFTDERQMYIVVTCVFFTASAPRLYGGGCPYCTNQYISEGILPSTKQGLTFGVIFDFY
jgi:hypothetical protein